MILGCCLCGLGLVFDCFGVGLRLMWVVFVMFDLLLICGWCLYMGFTVCLWVLCFEVFGVLFAGAFASLFCVVGVYSWATSGLLGGLGLCVV